MAKLIVIEGLDGSGKTTQLELLKAKFQDFCFLSFPCYDTLSGKIITEYLNGEFLEKDPEAGAYSASCFYAIDRYISFKKAWGTAYAGNGTIISSRYVSSNAIYQMAKLPNSEWDEYLEWQNKLEYDMFKLPKPTAVIFLDMPIEISQTMLAKRCLEENTKKDIHESNVAYLKRCREAALYVAVRQGFHIISCSENGQPRPRDAVHNDIVKQLEVCGC